MTRDEPPSTDLPSPGGDSTLRLEDSCDGGAIARAAGSPPRGAFFERLVENAPEGLLTIDTDGTVVYANPAVEDILGYEPADLVGNSKREMIPRRFRPVSEEALRRSAEADDRRVGRDAVELPARHADGHEVPVAVSVREHHVDGRRVFTVVFRDVSERRERERALRERNRRLERFASVLSHDLRNPLTVARGYVELLAEDLDRDELVELSDSLDRIDALIDETLGRTRDDESGPPVVELSIADVAEEAWRWVRTGDATLVVADDIGTVDADRSQLTSTFENLFTNAVQHGDPGATVRVEPIEDGGGFAVEDDGDGIPPAVRDRVFEDGFTTGDDGTGVGLARVRRMAVEHDWTVAVDESEAGGARFEFHT